MPKKFSLLLTLTLALAMSVFALWCVNKKAAAPVLTQPIPTTSETGTGSLETESRFVTNVDPDVTHWQTKETEFFTIKFPKEWYWIELSEKETEYRNMYVIANNQNFPLSDYKNDPIGMTGIDERTLLQDGEMVITFGAAATTNSGTPLDSLDFLTETRQDDLTRACVRPSNVQALPLIASCMSKDGNKNLQVYYIINENTSFFLRVHTSVQTIVSKDILENIARNIHLKY